MRLDWLVAPPCSLCDRAAQTAAFCRDCARQCRYNQQWQRFQHSSETLAAIPVLAWSTYSESLRRALQRLKYDKQQRIGETLGQWLAADLPWQQRLSLVPIPLHADRLKTRGYNQAEVISRALSRQRGDRHYPELLKRSRATTAQFGLSLVERQHNLDQAFVVQPQTIQPPLIVVDDIYTTGATITAARMALENAGYRVEGVVVVAVAPLSKTSDRT